MVVVVCKFREDAWNMIVKILLHIRDAFNFLAYLLSSISSLIYIDCNTSSNHWDGCSSNLLRDVLDWLDEKYKIVLSWIPESENLPTTGLSMIQKILISFDTVLGYFIIILGIFFEKQTQKNKIIQKIKDVLGDSSADTLSYSWCVGDGDEEVKDHSGDKPGNKVLKRRKAVGSSAKKKKKTNQRRKLRRKSQSRQSS